MTFGAEIFLKEILLISELFGFQNYRKSVDPSYLSGEKLAVMSTPSEAGIYKNLSN